MNNTPRWFEALPLVRPQRLNEVKRVSRALAMTNPMSTDRHQQYMYHSNLAPQTEHSVASTGISAPHAPHSAVSVFF